MCHGRGRASTRSTTRHARSASRSSSASRGPRSSTATRSRCSRSWRSPPRTPRVAVALVAFVAITLALPTVVSLLGTNYLAPRNVLYAWPLLALLAALGIGRPGAGRVSAAGLVLGLAVSLAIVVAVATTPRLQREDWRGLLHELGPAPGPRAVAVVNGFTIVPVVRY